ncbi:unnamed protein product [Rhizoctonia solani]|uniref:Uncharacterized protein n=1 Tax=Rhizoctonia solani TaxID=456999 RepID=A0A8H3E0T7_9AGAM|nr:unnamed protein product [Rhizoctonia solani]
MRMLPKQLIRLDAIRHDTEPLDMCRIFSLEPGQPGQAPLRLRLASSPERYVPSNEVWSLCHNGPHGQLGGDKVQIRVSVHEASSSEHSRTGCGPFPREAVHMCLKRFELVRR